MATLKQDLVRLRKLKTADREAKQKYETAHSEFKKWEAHCMERMRSEETDALRADGTLFTPVEKVYATVQDRQAFVRWAQTNDPELVEYKERGELLNALVRGSLDDGEELPEGVGFYTRDYISQRTS